MPGSVVPNGNSSEDISAWAVEGVWSTASSNTIRSATALRIGILLASIELGLGVVQGQRQSWPGVNP
jgi:hypothetical protein